MSAGAGTEAYQKALDLERLMVAAFGPDFREKVLVLPLGVWPLRDAFEECGLVDPRAPAPAPSSEAYGLWQTMPATHMLAGAQRTPAEQVAAAARYMAERYPAHEGLRALRTEQYRRFASPSAMGIERERERVALHDFRPFLRVRYGLMGAWHAKAYPMPSSPAPRSPHGDPLL